MSEKHLTEPLWKTLVSRLGVKDIGGLLEIMADSWFGDLACPDLASSRIFWGVVLLLLGGVIWRELR